MSKTIYVSISEVNELQTRIMHCVDAWVHKEKVPIPLKEILNCMEKEGTKPPTTIKSIEILIRKGYIRRTVTTFHNKTAFVMLRRV